MTTCAKVEHNASIVYFIVYYQHSMVVLNTFFSFFLYRKKVLIFLK